MAFNSLSEWYIDWIWLTMPENYLPRTKWIKVKREWRGKKKRLPSSYFQWSKSGGWVSEKSNAQISYLLECFWPAMVRPVNKKEHRHYWTVGVISSINTIQLFHLWYCVAHHSSANLLKQMLQIWNKHAIKNTYQFSDFRLCTHAILSSYFHFHACHKSTTISMHSKSRIAS